MTDPDDKVAVNAVIALGNIVVNNLDAEQQPALPVETVSLIMQAMLQRVSVCLQNGSVKEADKMLTTIINSVSMSDDQIFEQIPALVTLCEQIMASDFPEDTKKITLKIFTEIVEVSAEVRKQLRDMLQNFIRNYVIPRLVLGEEVILALLREGLRVRGQHDAGCVREVCLCGCLQPGQADNEPAAA